MNTKSAFDLWTKERRCEFRPPKVGISWKFEIILFHELVASGKKLFLYLEVLHLISWKVLELLNQYKGLRCGGSNRRGEVVKGVEHISTIVLVNI